jgi:hypothetical protein
LGGSKQEVQKVGKFRTGSSEDREVENRKLRSVGRLRTGSWEDCEVKNRK